MPYGDIGKHMNKAPVAEAVGGSPPFWIYSLRKQCNIRRLNSESS